MVEHIVQDIPGVESELYCSTQYPFLLFPGICNLMYGQYLNSVQGILINHLRSYKTIPNKRHIRMLLHVAADVMRCYWTMRLATGYNRRVMLISTLI